MLFYSTRRTNTPSTRRGTCRPFATAEAGEALHLTWMLKSFATGVTLLGLSYWLVQIAGVQYLASLTSGTLLAFLLAYVVWCLLHRNKPPRQRSDGASRMEAGNISPVVGTTVPLTPTPPPPFDHHQTYKYVTTAPVRDLSPPPTYEEAIRAMMSTTTCTPGLTYQPPVSAEAGPQPPLLQMAHLPSTVPAVTVSRLSPTALTSSPSLALISPPQTALTSSLSSPSALTSDSAPVLQTLSALTQQTPGSADQSQSVLTPQSSTDIRQIAPTALTPSTVLLIPSEHPTPHIGEVL